MPHLLIERQRDVITSLKLPPRRLDSDPGHDSWRKWVCALMVEVAELLSGIMFILGSICFFPSVSRDIVFFKFGCTCFIAGGVVYTIISMYTLVESVSFTGLFALEPFENLLYLLGSMCFGLGSILYWPTFLPNPGDSNEFEVKAGRGPNYMPVYVNTFKPAFE